MAIVSTETMEASIVRAIEKSAEKIREDAITAAVENFEKELRKNVLNSAISLTDFYDMYRDGQNLIITVRHIGATK